MSYIASILPKVWNSHHGVFELFPHNLRKVVELISLAFDKRSPLTLHWPLPVVRWVKACEECGSNDFENYGNPCSRSDCKKALVPLHTLSIDRSFDVNYTTVSVEPPPGNRARRRLWKK